MTQAQSMMGTHIKESPVESYLSAAESVSPWVSLKIIITPLQYNRLHLRSYHKTVACFLLTALSNFVRFLFVNVLKCRTVKSDLDDALKM